MGKFKGNFKFIYRKNINIDYFKNEFAINIVKYFIESTKGGDVGDCPYLKNFIDFLNKTDLGPKEVNIICSNMEITILNVVKNKIDENYLLEVIIEVKNIIKKNIGGIYEKYSKEINKQNNKLEKKNEELVELKNTMKIQLEVLRTTLNELNEKNEELDNISNTDELTGIANRRKFNDIFKNEVNRAKRTDSIFSLIVIDIDYFKIFNDKFGHDKGDIVLKKVSSIINSIVRESDTFARYGGEEFIIILPETDIIGGITLAEKIRKSIESTKLGNDFINNGEAVNLTVSQGVCQYNGEETSDEVFKKSDLALYEAKDSGRNAVCVNES